MKQLTTIQSVAMLVTLMALAGCRDTTSLTNPDVQPPALTDVTASTTRPVRAYVTNYNSDDVSVIDVATSRVVTTVPVGNGPGNVAATPDGAFAYVTNGYDGTVSVIDDATSAVVATIDGVGWGAVGIAITPDGAFAYVAIYAPPAPGSVSVIATASNTVIGTIENVGVAPFEVAVTPDGASVFVTNAYSDDLAVIDVATNTVETMIPVGQFPVGIAFTPDGSTAYVINEEDATVSVIDVATREVTTTIALPGPAFAVAFSPDGAAAYVTIEEDPGSIAVIDVATNTVTRTIPGLGRYPNGIAVTPDGGTAYVANTSSSPGSVSVIDLDAGSVLTTIEVGTTPGWVAMTPGEYSGPRPIGPIAQVSAGFTHTCAAESDGTVWCWGRNDYGQASAPFGSFTQVSAGYGHSCAVATDQTIHCWGYNGSGQLNAPAGTFSQVSAAGHTCAVASDGTVHCWGGYNDHGELDAPSGNFTQVSAGEMHTCALATDGTIHCWGNNVFLQTDAPAGNNFTQLSAGRYHTCALATDGTVGTVHCWGYNGFGQLNVPAGNFTQVSAGKGLEGQTCALGTDGSVQCWGADQAGLLSPPAGNFEQVSLGGYHACAVASDGSVQCWGDNWWGQLGGPSSVFTSTGSDVSVRPPEENTGQAGDVTITFGEVSASGETSVTTSETGPEAPAGFQLGDPPVYYEITTTATYSGSIEICFDYSGQSFTSEPAIQHYEEINDNNPPDSAWVPVPTTSHNLTTHIICGTVTSLSPFLLAQENTDPVASAGGPYTGAEGGAVALSFSGSDGDGDALTYAWDLGDGTMGTGDTPPTAHTYLDNGTYTITLTASDAYGGMHTATTMATIANVAPSVGPVSAASEPVAVGTAVTVGAEFTDPGTNDSHTAAIDWGDGTVSPAGVSETDGSGSATDTHSYVTPGVYTVKASVTDNDGGTGESVYEFVVVYDPSGGFVTGGGWIYSKPEAFVADPSFEGKATFGFVSKYTKGAEQPTGTTEFQFRAGNLTFHSTSYEWLVVTGSEYARFKGSGTINSSGNYRFMVWAGDGSPDTFRIRIWQEDEAGVETVTYDNGFDQALGGGSIVVHAN